jgi:hypothetical protein
MSMRDPLDLPRVSPSAAMDSLKIVSSANERHKAIAANRHVFRAGYALPPAALRRIGNHSLHIDQWEAGVAWAYPELNWRPLPVFQSYVAYTSALDDRNAHFLASRDAPRYILRRPLLIDERNTRFHTPNAEVEMLCRYRQVAVFRGWQLLERGHDRCGPPGRLGTKRAGFGARVAVPPGRRPDDMLVASFRDITQPLSQTVLRLLLKGSVVYIGINGERVERFLLGHAEHLHVLRLPACLGYSPELRRYWGRVRNAPRHGELNPYLYDTIPYRSIALGRGRASVRRPSRQSGAYTVSFYRIPFDCTGHSPRGAV